jgi:hypothetical protein
VEVSLDTAEVLAAVRLAKSRMNASGGCDREKYKRKGLPQMAYDCCAAYGEFAVAKFLGLPEPDGVNTWHAPDVGDRIQVRSIGITEPGGPPPETKSLIVRPNDSPHHVFVLVWVDMTAARETRDCRILGFMEGGDAQLHAWWREDAWFVPQSALRPASELAAYLNLASGQMVSVDEIRWSM